MLTTVEAAELAAVTPSTVKRWADGGLLPHVRTPGGHRRFDRQALHQFLRDQAGWSRTVGSPVASWIDGLVAGLRHEVDELMLEARARLGTWFHVADELGTVLAQMGKEWECGRLTVAQEHAASETLMRALTRIGDSLPMRLTGRRCLLACAGEDDHSLGLSLAELCLREAGWIPLWLGRRTPVSEIIRLVGQGGLSAVALSASAVSGNANTLARLAGRLGGVCRKRGVALVLGGSGAWPKRPRYGDRLTSFQVFAAYLARKERP